MIYSLYILQIYLVKVPIEKERTKSPKESILPEFSLLSIVLAIRFPFLRSGISLSSHSPNLIHINNTIIIIVEPEEFIIILFLFNLLNA